MNVPAPLYHYTCDHHIDLIRVQGVLRPTRDLVTDRVTLWLTDLEAPNRYGLGLTSHLIRCDRTRHRLVVPDPINVHRWVDVRRQYPDWWVAALEMAPGVLPMHWYVTWHPQRIERVAA